MNNFGDWLREQMIKEKQALRKYGCDEYGLIFHHRTRLHAFEQALQEFVNSRPTENDDMVLYRGYQIERVNPPGPGILFQFQHEEFVGDGDKRTGISSCVSDAKDQIDSLEDD